MMERVGARDRPERGIPLSPLEMVFLMVLSGHFCRLTLLIATLKPHLATLFYG